MENYDQLGLPKPEPFALGGKEWAFLGVQMVLGWLLCNSMVYGGLNLGFALCAVASVLCAFFYLVASGHRPDGYSGSLLALAVVIAVGFARSDDGFVKAVLLMFLVVAVNLGLCLLAGKNRYSPGSVRSLREVGFTVFFMGFGKLPESMGGLGASFKNAGNAGKKSGQVLLGLLLCIPVLLLVIPLLTSADAAFEGVMQLLPKLKMEELVVTALFGTFLGAILFSRSVGLHHGDREQGKAPVGKGINAVTVNTVLVAVLFVYGVYLLSQLAYLFGGLSGILPEGYSLAEYARRGFFEMETLCGINLTVLVIALRSVRRHGPTPFATKLLALLLGCITLFLVATASAKMFLYIGSYGLTRQRLLTQIIMLFMAVTTVTIDLWLFVPKLPYMKVVLLAGLVIGAATMWADVNTQVANYNANAYLTGRMEKVDLDYLKRLGGSALPALERIAEEAPTGHIRKKAQQYMNQVASQNSTGADIRGWNYVNQMAENYWQE